MLGLDVRKKLLLLLLLATLFTTHVGAQDAFVTLDNGNLSTVDTTTNTVLSSLPAGKGAKAVAVSPDGLKVYVACSLLNGVQVVDALTRQVLAFVPTGPRPWSIALTPDGSKLYVADGWPDIAYYHFEVVNTANLSVQRFEILGELGPVCISPDGKWMVASFLGNFLSLLVFSTATNQLVHQFDYDGGALAFSAPMHKLYCANWQSGDVSVYDTDHWTLKNTIRLGTWINDICASSDGSMVYVAAPNAITSIRTPDDVVTQWTYCPSIRSVAFCDNGGKLLVATGFGLASIDPITQVETDINVPSANVTGNFVQRAPARLYIPNSADNTVSIIDTDSGALTGIMGVGSQPVCVAVTPDKLQVWCVNQGSDNVTVLTTTSRNPMTAVYLAPGSRPAGMAFSPDGKRAIICNSGTNTASIIDATGYRVLGTRNVGIAPQHAAFNGDGSRAYVVNTGSDTISVIDIKNLRVMTTIALARGSAPKGIAISPDSSRLYVAQQNTNQVAVINTAFNAVVSTLNTGQGPSGVLLSPNGTMLYVANEQAMSVTSINLLNGTATSIHVGMNPRGLALNPNHATLFVSNSAWNTVSAIATFGNVYLGTLTLGQGPGDMAMGLVPKPSVAYVANDVDNSITILNTALNSTFSEAYVGSAPNSIALSKDGRFGLSTSGGSGNVCLTDLLAYQASPIPVESGAMPTGAAITNDNKQAVVVESALNKIIWIDLASHSVVASTTVGLGPRRIVLTPDGSTAYVSNRDSDSVSVVDVASHSVLATVSLPTGSHPTCIAMRPSGGEVYVSCPGSGYVCAIRVSDNRFTGRIKVGSGPSGLSFACDGLRAFVANTLSNSISVIDTFTRGVVNVPAGPAPVAVQASWDNNRIYIADHGNSTVQVLDGISFTPITTLPWAGGPADIQIRPGT